MSLNRINIIFLLNVVLAIKSWRGGWLGAPLGGRFLQIPDLFDEVRLLVVELLVVRAILLEVVQEVDELRLVL